MNTFATGSLPVHFSVAKLFNFRWQYTLGISQEIVVFPQAILEIPAPGPVVPNRLVRDVPWRAFWRGCFHQTR